MTEMDFDRQKEGLSMCVVYLLSEQTKLRQVGGRFLLEKKGKRQASIPMDEVECVIQGKAAEITTPAIYELLARGVCIFYVDGRGRLLGQLGQFASSNLSWERSRIQYDTVRDEQRQVELTREIVRLKMNGQIELLRSYAKSKKDLELAYLADEVRKYRKKLAVTSAIEELRGLEGMASRRYFEAFPMILDSKSWDWNGRNRRPPEDPVNALLSYGYAFLEREVRLAILGARLDVRMGFLHSNNGRKDSLVYDLMEPFRQLVIDRLVLKAVNRGQFHPEDFSYDDVLGCRLSEKAREGWISYYETYMQRSCSEYQGLAPREWIRSWVRQFADELFRNAASAV